MTQRAIFTGCSFFIFNVDKQKQLVYSCIQKEVIKVSNKEAIVSTRINKKAVKMLDDLAVKEHMTRATLIRRLIMKGLGK